jgi:anti-sigma factor RsiW
MRDAEKQNLPDPLRWGRDWSPEDEALLRSFLAANPGEQRALEDDLSLNKLLKQLPDARVSSNFTAQVMRAVQEQDRSKPVRGGWLREFMPGKWRARLASATLLLGIGLFSYQHHQLTTTRKAMAQSVAALSEVAMVSGFEALQDFEAIERLSQVRHDIDFELIVALQNFNP